MMNAKRYNNWILFFIFATILVVKCCLFQYTAFHSFIISGIFANPSYGLPWWGLKIFLPIAVAGLMFFFRRNWWTILFLLFVDVWMLANMMYLRSNGILLNGYAMSMASNMDGFWGSVLVLWTWVDLLPFVLTAMYAIVYILCQHTTQHMPSKKNMIVGSSIVLVGLALNQLSVAAMKKYQIISDGEDVPKAMIRYCLINPYSFENRDAFTHINNDYAYEEFSIIHGFVFSMCEYIDVLLEKSQSYEFTADEKAILSQLTIKSYDKIHNDRPLVVILIESLESWAVHPDIMPNLYNFIYQRGGYYIPNVYSQIRGGLSADGQMIVTTGLLPIKKGATCFRYPYNTYPSWVDREKSSTVILTHGERVWNQSQMSIRYGFMETMPGDVQDSILFYRIVESLKLGKKTVLGITVRSHVPFQDAYMSKVDYPKDMPTLMQNYMKCLRLTDDGLSVLFSKMDSVPELKTAYIIITGDHTVFWPEIRHEFASYCTQIGLDYEISSATTPCIIYDKTCNAPMKIIDDAAYQMDIYPTILALSNNTQYYWKGFGVNMLEPNFNANRLVTQDEAYDLSDKMIRANYFEKKR